MSKYIKWLFSPEMVARKRTIIVFLVSLAGGLNASVPMLQFACAGIESAICRVDAHVVAGIILKFTNLLNTPEMGGVAFLTGLYAIFSGFKKDKK